MQVLEAPLWRADVPRAVAGRGGAGEERRVVSHGARHLKAVRRAGEVEDVAEL
eukprot:CAMPEP_0173397580 /NCGR_PEP_ID=MMETSP1356-20130122/38863_1 /TAXON_ID=77927 ORGANISM="Hemiselmis virescens, Strain PCC157" /NCGR_SAMPLE_ID=MMETSP1356 /ASSEMBLY_ACC=CAM_ASM_000847 /LENGTH=52 /DNA_ID=CAMNT_0014356865 /DNA_START=190 /DNA_END=348 /DNA_ORIENTATION=-